MPFAGNTFSVNFAFPDVINIPTPAGPIPVPFPDIEFSATRVPTQFKFIICGGLSENILAVGTVSIDAAGLGVASGTSFMGGRTLIGSTCVLSGVAPATHLSSITGQNGMSANAPGMNAIPGQPRMLILR